MLNEYSLSVYHYGIYSLLCLPFSFVLAYCLPYRLKHSFYVTVLFFYLLSICLFFLGCLLACALFWALKSTPLPKKRKKGIEYLALPDYQKAPVLHRAYFGESTSAQLMQKNAFSSETRKKMMIALNEFQTGSVNTLNKRLLSDEEDEIRLYAQSIIDQQEIKLFKMIHHINVLWERERDPQRKAVLKKHTVQFMWEHIRQALADEDNLGMMLDKIKRAAQAAFEQLPEDSALPLLLVQIYLKQHDLLAAKHWIAIAQRNQVAHYRIALYLGEIAFREKRFADIRLCLAHLKHSGVMGAESVIDFWSMDD